MYQTLKKYHPVPALVSGLFIFILCILPGEAIPQETWLDRIHADKWVHLILFFVWVFVWLQGNSTNNKLKPAHILLCALIYGAVMELIQGLWIEGRSGDAVDWLTDAAGSILAFWLSVTHDPGKHKASSNQQKK